MKRLVIFLLFLPVLSLSANPTPREIMELADSRDGIEQAISEMILQLEDADGELRFLNFLSYEEGERNGSRWSLLFTGPEELLGTGVLSLDAYNGGEDLQQLYLPETDTFETIPSDEGALSLAGSDFSYWDLKKIDLDDYSYSLYQEGKVDGQDVWVILALPVSDEIRRRSGYEKSIYFIRRDDYLIVRSKHWTLRSGEVKYRLGEDIRMIDGLWYPTRIEMIVKRNNNFYHSTTMRRKSTDIDTPIAPEYFTTEGLRSLSRELTGAEAAEAAAEAEAAALEEAAADETGEVSPAGDNPGSEPSTDPAP